MRSSLLLAGLGAAALTLVLGCPPAGMDGDGGMCPEPPPPTLTGSFTGMATCPTSMRTVDLMLQQEPGDEDVDGYLLFDWSVRYQDGLIDVVVQHVIRTTLTGAELDDEGVLSGLALTEVVAPTASAPDFSIELALQPGPTPDALRGSLHQLNANNDPVATCDLVVARLGTPLPPLTDGGDADGG